MQKRNTKRYKKAGMPPTNKQTRKIVNPSVAAEIQRLIEKQQQNEIVPPSPVTKKRVTIRKRCPRGTNFYKGRCLTKEEIQEEKMRELEEIINRPTPPAAAESGTSSLAEEIAEPLSLDSTPTPAESPSSAAIPSPQPAVIEAEPLRKTIRKRCPRGTNFYKGECLTKQQIQEAKLRELEEIINRPTPPAAEIEPISVESASPELEPIPKDVKPTTLPEKKESPETLEDVLEEPSAPPSPEKTPSSATATETGTESSTPETPTPTPPTPEEKEAFEPVPGHENEFLLEKERDEFKENETDKSYDFLYPHANDPNFAYKIATKKEFADFQYDGTVYDIKSHSDKLCSAPFELMPHQMFVKNFLSFQTPYNSLLLYHGLGSGKSMSAIGITEEMRDYLKQTGMLNKKIMIIATPNVQANFRKELFNEKRLEEKDGLWTLNTVIGNKLLREINPTNIKHIPREKIITMINSIINTYYEFMGYIEFANYVENITQLGDENNKRFTDKQKQLYEIQQIRRVFNDRLIVVDEVHNIRFTEDNKKKRSGMKLLKAARYSDNLRLLLLSATPMYNNFSEIIWLTNVLNINDKRATIQYKDVFNKRGEFIKQHKTRAGKFVEGGRELLLRKLTGYVSFVRTENPYTFPFRIYPRDFAAGAQPPRYFGNEEGAAKYPTKQLNGQLITEPLNNIQVYITHIEDEQERGYKLILNTIVREKFVNEVFENMESFGYSLLQTPLEALNIVYPSAVTDSAPAEETAEEGTVLAAPIQTRKMATAIIGRAGLSGVMNWVGKDREPAPPRHDFEYTDEALDKYGAIFSPAIIRKYSHKIADICENIRAGARGIILIYSNYIDSGVVPMALALEEMGFTRFGTTPNTKNLFKTPPAESIDYLMRKREDVESLGEPFYPASYVMITGDKSFSAANAEDLKYIVSPENKNGERVKVVLISRTGSEGLDFKCIRQVHILDSWYNMSRIEQIVGRGVRNLSHCYLPFEERNVEIYLHGTILKSTPEEEAIDLYLYRSAEKKARDIGRITRIMKETAVDCYLNIGQTNFTVDRMNALAANQNVKIRISSGKEIGFRVGDRPNSELCDYMEDCNFKCMGPPAPAPDSVPDIRTYNEAFMDMNKDVIIIRIRQLFREQSIYRRSKLIAAINSIKKYPIEQIFAALTAFINNENEYLIDKLGRFGTMTNRGEYYMFQPLEITDKRATIFERIAPVDYKREKLQLEVPAAATLEADSGEMRGETAPAAATETAAVAAAAPSDIMASFYENINMYDTFNPEEKLKQRELNWYKHARMITEHVHLTHKIPIENIRDYVIEHMVDVFPYKLALLRYFFGIGDGNAGFREETATPLDLKIRSYLESKYVENAEFGLYGYLIDENDRWRIYLKTSQGFERAEEDDKKNLIESLKDFRYPYKMFHNYVGYISPIKEGEKELVFRIKNMSQKRGNKGFVCRNSGKEDLLKIINYITNAGENLYTNENTQGLLQASFCCISEILFRYYNDMDENKIWFLPPEEALINDIYKRKE